jgi:hypothetical protein
MKILICDPCKKEDNVVTETSNYLKVKGNPALRLDVCEKHKAKLHSMGMIDYVKYCYKLNFNMDVAGTDQEIKERYLVR